MSDDTESSVLDVESVKDLEGDEDDQSDSNATSPNGPLTEQISSQIPLQRIAMSVRYKKNRGSKILRGGWMVHFTNKDRTVRDITCCF